MTGRPDGSAGMPAPSARPARRPRPASRWQLEQSTPPTPPRGGSGMTRLLQRPRFPGQSRTARARCPVSGAVETRSPNRQASQVVAHPLGPQQPVGLSGLQRSQRTDTGRAPQCRVRPDSRVSWPAPARHRCSHARRPAARVRCRGRGPTRSRSGQAARHASRAVQNGSLPLQAADADHRRRPARRPWCGPRPPQRGAGGRRRSEARPPSVLAAACAAAPNSRQQARHHLAITRSQRAAGSRPRAFHADPAGRAGAARKSSIHASNPARDEQRLRLPAPGPAPGSAADGLPRSRHSAISASSRARPIPCPRARGRTNSSEIQPSKVVKFSRRRKWRIPIPSCLARHLGQERRHVRRAEQRREARLQAPPGLSRSARHGARGPSPRHRPGRRGRSAAAPRRMARAPPGRRPAARGSPGLIGP